jgi:hypothetical protein
MRAQRVRQRSRGHAAFFASQKALCGAMTTATVLKSRPLPSGLGSAVHRADLLVASKNSLAHQFGKRLVPAASKARHRGACDGTLSGLGVGGSCCLGGVAQPVFGDLGLRGLVSSAHVILSLRVNPTIWGLSTAPSSNSGRWATQGLGLRDSRDVRLRLINDNWRHAAHR